MITPYLSKVLEFLVKDCKVADNISEKEYFLVFKDKKYEGLNCALIELKKFIFYNFSPDKNINLLLSLYTYRLRRIILCEKRFYFSINKIDFFYEKWKYFAPVYQIHGPDPLY